MSIFSFKLPKYHGWPNVGSMHAKDYLKVNDIMNQLCVPKFRHSNAFEMPKFKQRNFGKKNPTDSEEKI